MMKRERTKENEQEGVIRGLADLVSLGALVVHRLVAVLAVREYHEEGRV